VPDHQQFGGAIQRRPVEEELQGGEEARCRSFMKVSSISATMASVVRMIRPSGFEVSINVFHPELAIEEDNLV
jgi:hypothetical protein